MGTYNYFMYVRNKKNIRDLSDEAEHVWVINLDPADWEFSPANLGVQTNVHGALLFTIE